MALKRHGGGGRLALALAGLVCLTLAPLAAAERAPGRAELLGITPAEERMRGATPTGRGIVVAQVEGDVQRYLPATDDRRYRGITFRARSGESETLGHASAVLRVYAGRGGLAPGVREVHHFAASHWLTDGYLRAGQPRPPAEDIPRLYTHSWIGRGSHVGDAEINHVLRRTDDAIDRHGVVMCVGVDNGRNRPVPGLLGSAHNVIAVGKTDGASSGGGTRIEGTGRSKPDITAPAGTTSAATPMVAAVTARLLQAADSMRPDADDAARPETIKALLMAGATKPAGWEQRDGRPLDAHLGAGAVHLDNALRILYAGRASPDQPRPRHGWDLRSFEAGEQATYHLAARGPVEELSLMLVWHRRIDGRVVAHPPLQQRTWLEAPRHARFEVRIYQQDEDGERPLRAESVSAVDNVQHIHLRDLPPGDYHFEVTRLRESHDEPWPVAIAWRAGPHVPYPGEALR